MPDFPGYPLRPVNGGPIETAAPKLGKHLAQPKHNGKRIWIHAESGVMYNRHGKSISNPRLYESALSNLRANYVQPIHDRLKKKPWPKPLAAPGYGKPTVAEVYKPSDLWLDSEGLGTRSEVAQGVLVVFDFFHPLFQWMPLEDRLDQIIEINPLMPGVMPNEGTLWRIYTFPWEDAEVWWSRLKEFNKGWGLDTFYNAFYEGIVVKRADSQYVINTTDPAKEFTGWVKHRYHRGADAPAKRTKAITAEGVSRAFVMDDE